MISGVGTLEVDAPAPSSTRRPGFWWRVLGPVGATIAGLAVAVAVIAILAAAGVGDDESAALATLSGSAALLGFGLLLLRGLPRHERRLALATKGRLGSSIGIGAAAGFATLLIAGPMFALAEWLDPSVGRRLDDLADDTGLTGLVWADVLVIVSLVVLAPFGEELLDRALLLRGLARRLSFLPAAIISAAVFSLSHLDAWLLFLWPRAIWLVIIGLVLAWVYRRRGYAASVAAHATVNTVAAIALVATS